jgi:hypothetical protein
MVRAAKLEIDSAGLLMHAAECGVTDGVDDDADCTCGAHAINQRLVEVERLRAENLGLRQLLGTISELLETFNPDA